MPSQLEDRIKHLFAMSIETQMANADSLSSFITTAGSRLANCLLGDGKIVLCGNGGSYANCLHFSNSMLNHYEVERPPLPVMTLGLDGAMMTGIINEGVSDQVFARQIHALGQDKDILLILTTSGNANNIIQAITAAHERGMDSIVLNGRDGGVLSNHLGPEDLEINVLADTAARVREIHLFILHCFCDLIDNALFGQGG